MDYVLSDTSGMPCMLQVTYVGWRMCKNWDTRNYRKPVIGQFGRRSFSVASPMVWNSFPDSLRDLKLSIVNFRSTLKTHLFASPLMRYVSRCAANR